MDISQKKDKYSINSVKPLYLLVHEVDGFTEETEGKKYLNFAFTEILRKYAEIWSGINDQIKAMNNGKSV